MINKEFCLECRTTSCRAENHTHYFVHSNYRLPGKHRHRIWKKVKQAVVRNEPLPLWENRGLAPKGRCCPEPHQYKAIKLPAPTT